MLLFPQEIHRHSFKKRDCTKTAKILLPGRPSRPGPAPSPAVLTASPLADSGLLSWSNHIVCNRRNQTPRAHV